MKIVEYFFNRKIMPKNRIDIKEIGDGYWYATIYTKLPFMKRYCVWSTYDKNIESANAKAMKAVENKSIVKDEMSLGYRVITTPQLHFHSSNKGFLNASIISGTVLYRGEYKYELKKKTWSGCREQAKYQ